MRNIAVFKAADNLRNGVNLADMRKEFVAEAFALGRAFYKPCDIDKAHGGRHDFFGFKHFSQHVKTRIRHIYNAHIRFYGAERIVGSFCPCFGNSIKQRAFAYVRQAYNTYF